jgi:hypothetical protein
VFSASRDHHCWVHVCNDIQNQFFSFQIVTMVLLFIIQRTPDYPCKWRGDAQIMRKHMCNSSFSYDQEAMMIVEHAHLETDAEHLIVQFSL